MPKPRSDSPAAKADGKPKTIALTIKGSPEWRAWVDRGADHCRTDVAKLVDAALVEYLKGKDFKEDAPLR